MPKLNKFISRYFYAPALSEIIDKVSNSCTQCLATVRLPNALTKESSTIPTAFGTRFAADVMERNGQVIFVCKEVFISFLNIRKHFQFLYMKYFSDCMYIVVIRINRINIDSMISEFSEL